MSTSRTIARSFTRSAIRSPTSSTTSCSLAELTTLAARRYVLVLLGYARCSRGSRARARDRTLAAARDPRQLLPQAVPRLRAGVDLPGADARGRDPRPTSPACCSPTSQAEAARTAAVAQRVIEQSDALLRRGAEGVDAGRRRRDGLDQPVDQPGRQRLRRRGARGDQRARPVRLGPAADPHARRRLSRDRAAAAAQLRGRRPDRLVPVHAGGGAGPRRRPQRACSPCRSPSPARSRAGDRRSRSRRAPRGAVLHPARRRRWGCRWPSASPIRSAS